MQIVKKRPEETSWQQVKELVSQNMLKVGDDIIDDLSGIPIIYQVAEITEEEVHFVSKGVYPRRVPWNERGKTKGGFKDSDLKAWLEEGLYPLLPEELKEVISEREVYQNVEGEEARYKLKLWLPTEYEVFGEAWGNEYPEGQQFSLFRDPAERVKCDADTGDRANWWLLSVTSGYSTSACLVNSGGASYGTASIELRVPVCFTIRK